MLLGQTFPENASTKQKYLINLASCDKKWLIEESLVAQMFWKFKFLHSTKKDSEKC